MGVQVLWDVLSKAGQSRSLTHLAVADGFEKNDSGRRAYRIGIDASIWYQHAMHSTEGANPELRLLLFRLRRLAELPLIPLFIFDGRERPKVKRGSKMGKSGSHGLTSGFKKLLDIFGMEWRMALGEAEAELAYLNRVGVIDAVLTDDADALVFGAKTIIRNVSLNLTGNRANPATDSNGKASKHHVMTFSVDSIRSHPDIQLTRGGLLLFALLSGGDYDHGLKGFGPQAAHCLARLGFGDQLLTEHERCHGQDMGAFLSRWRAAMNTELHTNAHGFLRSRMPALSVPTDFPNMDVLRCYANPVCSASAGRQGGGRVRDNGDLSISRLAGFCEDHFDEWGYRSTIIKRFRDLVWDAAVMRVLRRAALEADEKERTSRIAAGRNDTAIRAPLRPPPAEGVGIPTALVKKYLDPGEEDRYAAAFVRRTDPAPGASEPDTNPLIRKIVGSRQHVSTDNILEYRVEVDPTQLVRLAESGIKGKHREPQANGSTGRACFDEDLPDVPEFIVGSSQGSFQGVSQASKAGSKNPPPEPCSVKRIWLPASMMLQVHPKAVADFEAAEEAKRAKKAAGKRKEMDDEEAEISSEEMEEAIRVGIPVTAMSSLPFRKCGFIFTFPDPDSPDMLAMEDDENTHALVDLDADEEDSSVSGQLSQAGQTTAPAASSPNTSTRRVGTAPRSQSSQRNGHAAGPVNGDDYDSDVEDDGVRTWQNAMRAGVHNPPASSQVTGRDKEKGKGKASARRPRASGSGSTASGPAAFRLDEVSAAFVNSVRAGDSDLDDAVLDDGTNTWMDAILLGPGKSKRKAPARDRKPRASAPARGSRAAAGVVHERRKSAQKSATAPRRRASTPLASPVRRPPAPPNRDPCPIPLLSPLGSRATTPDPLRSPSRTHSRDPLPLFLPSSSPPPAATGSRKRVRPSVVGDDDVIEIHSSGDERPPRPVHKKRARYGPPDAQTLSQLSRLSDKDSIIDRT